MSRAANVCMYKWRIHKILLWSFKPLHSFVLHFVTDFLMSSLSLFSQADVYNKNKIECMRNPFDDGQFFSCSSRENRHKRALKMMPPRGKMKNIIFCIFLKNKRNIRMYKKAVKGLPQLDYYKRKLTTSCNKFFLPFLLLNIWIIIIVNFLALISWKDGFVAWILEVCPIYFGQCCYLRFI